MLSFIVPAHNEEAWLARCLAAIRESVATIDEKHEIIVVDDASTDRSGAIAREHGVRVISVAHRQISASRNSGAREAQGDVLIFVDADTLVNEGIVRSLLRAVQEGAVGGGCVPRFDGAIPLWARLVYPFLVLGARLRRETGGACLFCTREVFAAVGGFSEKHFAAEEVVWINALKRHGHFVVVPGRVLTSGRNLRAHSFGAIAPILVRLALHGPDGFRDRRGLDLWYQPSREKPNPVDLDAGKS